MSDKSFAPTRNTNRIALRDNLSGLMNLLEVFVINNKHMSSSVLYPGEYDQMTNGGYFNITINSSSNTFSSVRFIRLSPFYSVLNWLFSLIQ